MTSISHHVPIYAIKVFNDVSNHFLCVPNGFFFTIVDLFKSLSYDQCGGEYHNFLIIVGSMFIKI
jgi:hypothetical protein